MERLLQLRGDFRQIPGGLICGVSFPLAAFGEEISGLVGDEYESDDDNYQEKDNQYGDKDSCQGHYQGKPSSAPEATGRPDRRWWC